MIPERIEETRPKFRCLFYPGLFFWSRTSPAEAWAKEEPAADFAISD
jgi:hypothetical protein